MTGARDVLVNGELYDVDFADGSCVDVFSGCTTAGSFLFQSESDAAAASQALLDQVMIDSPAGNFDSSPSGAIAGCYGGFTENDPPVCSARTPYDVVDDVGFTFVLVYASDNWDPTNSNPNWNFGNPHTFVDEIMPFGAGQDEDYALSSFETWAVWSPAASAVPVPAAAWMFGSALLTAFAAKKRRQ